jgi:hypothetical protein
MYEPLKMPDRTSGMNREGYDEWECRFRRELNLQGRIAYLEGHLNALKQRFDLQDRRIERLEDMLWNTRAKR